MEKLEFNYELSDHQREELYEVLINVSEDPYIDVELFKLEIFNLIKYQKIPHWFLEICGEWTNTNKFDHPMFLLKNVPIDKDLPVLNFRNPILAKYRLKKTNISECFLELFSQLCGQESIGYKFVNTGDIYQDIHPLESLKDTQSQKAIGNLGFHKDLANHFVKPDFVNIICLRNHEKNVVQTTFVKNKVLLEYLKELNLIDILKEEMYHTPYDALTQYGDTKSELGEAKKHRIIYSETDISFFEGRTIGLTEKHAEAVSKVVELLHFLKKGLHFLPGDFISSENNNCIHGKEIIATNEPEKLKERWMMKTVNLYNMDKANPYLMDGKKYIING